MLTLNLIPPQLKSDRLAANMLHRWFMALRLLLILVIIGTIGSITVWQLLSRHAKTVQADLNQLQQQGGGTGTDITATTGKLNTTIQTIAVTLGSPQSWPELTRTVFDILPSGVTISEFTLDPAGAFHLVGVADSRQTYINLEQLLKNSPQLKDISTTSSASKRSSVPFDFLGTVLPKATTP